MVVMLARSEHEVAYQDLAKLLTTHAAKISSEEMLCIAANMLGKLIAMQDQRTTSPERALEIVSKNIEMGNQQVIAQLANAFEGKA